ncbi:hypothetical protein ABE10_01210, partial [Bacillus toyonensis]|nr:hypothetical protein [Bacillus toyonensis]
ADQRIEEADVDHDPEEHDREHQQRRGRCHLGDRVEDHVAEPEPGAGEEAEGGRYEDEGDHRSEPLGHDERHEDEHHREAEDDEDPLRRHEG